MKAYNMALDDLSEVIRIGLANLHGPHRVFVVSPVVGPGGGNAPVRAQTGRCSALCIAYNDRGLVWMRMERYDNAFADLNEAFRLEPENGSGYNARGYVKLEQNDLDCAIEDLDHAIRLDPTNSSHYLLRGRVRVAKKEYDQAVGDYTEVVWHSPHEDESANRWEL